LTARTQPFNAGAMALLFCTGVLARSRF